MSPIRKKRGKVEPKSAQEDLRWKRGARRTELFFPLVLSPRFASILELKSRDKRMNERPDPPPIMNIIMITSTILICERRKRNEGIQG